MSWAMSQRRKANHVLFDEPLTVKVLSLDGTWWRTCRLVEMSDAGARIAFDGAGTVLSEFLLVLSSFGNPVYRRCKCAWVDGVQMGVHFDKGALKVKQAGPQLLEVMPAA